MKLEQLLIENFRGIRRLEIGVSRQNLIIVGENGSGKSSIIDALEYYFTGTLEKLTGRADVKAGSSIPHLKGGPTGVTMAFTGGDEPFTVTYPQRKAKMPRGLKASFDQANDHPFVLRRSQILDFINARPGERYEALSKIVGLGDLDTIDQVWRRQLKDAATEVDRLEQALAQIYGELSESLMTIVQSEQDLLEALDEWLLSAQLEPVQRREQIVERVRQLRGRLHSHPEPDGLQTLRQMQASLVETRRTLQALLDQQETLLDNLRAYRRHGKTIEDAPWERLLAEAHRLLHEGGDVEQCPLCEAPLADRRAFLGRLGQRVAELKALTRLRSQVRRSANGVAGSATTLQAHLEALGVMLASEASSIDRQVLEGARAQMDAWQRMLLSGRFFELEAASWRDDSSIEALLAFLNEIEGTVEKQIALTQWDDETEGLYELLQKLTVVDEQWQRLQHANDELLRKRYVREQISLVYEELIAARRRGVDRLSRALEEDFDRFYQRLHPDEGYEEIAIIPHEERRSSVDLTARFQGQEPSHPLGFWSEGHLDSLGLCIFLAFIRRFNGGFKLVALDDVLTTVDAGHRLRVARLLAREFADCQLIITTHDPLWAKQLQSVLPNCRLLSLKPWSLEQGTDFWENVVSDWAYYERQARAGRPQDAIAGAGRNLEKFLYQMRANLGLAVPAKANEAYTIGDLYPPFFSWISGRTITRSDRPAFKEELASLQQELDEIWRLRNWAGAHFNAWAATVTASEAIDFLGAVRELVASFECPACGNLVVYNRAASALICPVCEPQAPARQRWQYDPGWIGRVERIRKRDDAKARQNLRAMTIVFFAHFLQDMRRRVHLAVPATEDDAYAAAELYAPFLRWAREHPRSGHELWSEALDRHHHAILRFRQNGAWQVGDEAVQAFTDAVQQFIALFACAQCGQLLSFDESGENYYCGECDGRHDADVEGAYWFVAR